MWSLCIYAFRRGGWEEKLTIAGFIVAAYLSVLVAGPNETSFQQVEVQIAYVDLGLFIVMQIVAFRSKKYWPLWAGALQGMMLLTHFAPLMPNMLPSTYYNAEAFWTYPVMVILAFGVRNHHRAKVRSHFVTY